MNPTVSQHPRRATPAAGLCRAVPGRELSSLPELKRWHKSPLSACRAEVSQAHGARVGGSAWLLLGLGYGTRGCGSREQERWPWAGSPGGRDFLLCSSDSAAICSERDARQDKHRKDWDFLAKSRWKEML